MAGISSHPVLRQALLGLRSSVSSVCPFFRFLVLPCLLRSSVSSPFFCPFSVFCSFSLSACPFFCSWFFCLSVSSPFFCSWFFYSWFFCPFSVMRFPRRKTFVSNSCVAAQKTRYCQIFCHDARLFAKTLASWKNIKN